MCANLLRTPATTGMNQAGDVNGPTALWDQFWAMLEKTVAYVLSVRCAVNCVRTMDEHRWYTEKNATNAETLVCFLLTFEAPNAGRFTFNLKNINAVKEKNPWKGSKFPPNGNAAYLATGKERKISFVAIIIIRGPSWENYLTYASLSSF